MRLRRSGGLPAMLGRRAHRSLPTVEPGEDPYLHSVSTRCTSAWPSPLASIVKWIVMKETKLSSGPGPMNCCVSVNVAAYGGALRSSLKAETFTTW